jgi:hypothetical protein
MVVTHALMTQLTVMRWARSYRLLVHSAFNAKRRNQWLYIQNTSIVTVPE